MCKSLEMRDFFIATFLGTGIKPANFASRKPNSNYPS